MGQLYPELNLTDFPDKIDAQEIYEDINIETKILADLYYDYINSGNFSAANQILIDNPKLKRSILTAEQMNRKEHQIIAMQKFYMSDFQKYISNAIQFKGEWDNSIIYNKLNVVKYLELYYIAIEPDVPIGTLPTNTLFWFPMSIKGEQGESGFGLTPRGGWSNLIQYYQYDLATYNNFLWFANNDNINSIPSDSNPNWTQMLILELSGIETNTTVTTVDLDGTISVDVKDIFATNENLNELSENKQNKINASGILIGDGDGNISSAIANTDYTTPQNVQNSINSTFNSRIIISQTTPTVVNGSIWIKY